MTALAIPDDLVKVMAGARRVVVLTGAGVSAESGVPTFRDAQTGLWAQYDPAQLATPEAFRSNPELVWGWYLWRRELTRKAEPNPGHEALARLQDLVDELVLVTQNVDGLHARAGSRDVIELHGNIMRTVCFRCRVEDGREVVLDEGVPQCTMCGGPLRPDVVWFGEPLPMNALARAADAARAADVFLSVGTSSLVYPAAALPYEALTVGVPVVEVNPETTALSGRATWTLRGPSGEVLPLIVATIRPPSP
jgi:NAD-dependent deacetylase